MRGTRHRRCVVSFFDVLGSKMWRVWQWEGVEKARVLVGFLGGEIWWFLLGDMIRMILERLFVSKIPIKSTNHHQTTTSYNKISQCFLFSDETTRFTPFFLFERLPSHRSEAMPLWTFWNLPFFYWDVFPGATFGLNDRWVKLTPWDIHLGPRRGNMWNIQHPSRLSGFDGLNTEVSAFLANLPRTAGEHFEKKHVFFFVPKRWWMWWCVCVGRKKLIGKGVVLWVFQDRP